MIEYRHDLCYINPDIPINFISTPKPSNIDFFKEWLANRRPLMVTRQQDNLPDNLMRLGLSYFDINTRHKHRLSFLIDKKYIINCTPLPKIETIFPDILGFHNLRIDIGVYGSYCWEFLSLETQTTPSSDIDLLLNYNDQSIFTLSKIVAKLQGMLGNKKIDGEVRFKKLGDFALDELVNQQSPTLVLKNINEVKLIERQALYEIFPSLLS